MFQTAIGFFDSAGFVGGEFAANFSEVDVLG
jgi:hypothetical protein